MSINFYQERKASTTWSQIKADWTCLYIFDISQPTFAYKFQWDCNDWLDGLKKLQPHLLLLSKSCKTRYILYIGGQFFPCLRGQGVGSVPNVHVSPRQVGRWSDKVKIWSMQFVNDPLCKSLPTVVKLLVKFGRVLLIIITRASCRRVGPCKPCQVFVQLQGLGSSQLADNLVNEINQGPCYVRY